MCALPLHSLAMVLTGIAKCYFKCVCVIPKGEFLLWAFRHLMALVLKGLTTRFLKCLQPFFLLLNVEGKFLKKNVIRRVRVAADGFMKN